MFERFTDRARAVVIFAQEEARRLKHRDIGTEHLLAALLIEEGVVSEALGALGISLADVRREIDEIVGPGESPPGAHLPFTVGAKRTLELSLREALQLGHNYIGTEHLILGLVSQEDELGAQILERLGADERRIRQQVTRLVTPGRATIRGPGSVGDEAASGDAPRCPDCRTELEGHVRSRTLDVRDEPDARASRTVVVVWCGTCGSTLGMLPG